MCAIKIVNGTMHKHMESISHYLWYSAFVSDLICGSAFGCLPLKDNAIFCYNCCAWWSNNWFRTIGCSHNTHAAPWNNDAYSLHPNFLGPLGHVISPNSTFSSAYLLWWCCSYFLWELTVLNMKWPAHSCHASSSTLLCLLCFGWEQKQCLCTSS